MIRRLLMAMLVSLIGTGVNAATRIKDITAVQGVRANQLVGYGLVVGLNGTGDSLRNSPFTEQSLQSMLQHLGINVHGVAMRNRNVAAVIVTTDLSPVVQIGSRIDMNVSSLGDATSLKGGTLLMTPLKGSDGGLYAGAQGAVSCPALPPRAKPTLSQGVPTDGRIPNGGIVQQEIAAPPDQLRSMLELRNPDYATAVRIVDAINAYSLPRFRVRAAFEVDSRTVELFVHIMSRSRGSWRRSASYRSSPTWPRAWCWTPVRAQSSSVRTCRSRLSPSLMERSLSVSTNSRASRSPTPSPPAAPSSPRIQDRRGTVGRPDRHSRRIKPADAGQRPEPNRSQAAGNYRHPPGHQDRGCAPGRSRDSVGVRGASGQPSAALRRCRPVSRPPMSRKACLLMSVGVLASAASLTGPAPAQDGRAPEAQKPKPVADKPAETEASRYCANVVPSIAEARIAWQTKRLSELDAQVKQRIADLEKAEAAAREWIDKRQALFENDEDDDLVAIYAKMQPENAARQIDGTTSADAGWLRSRPACRRRALASEPLARGRPALVRVL